MIEKHIDQYAVPLENWDHFVELSKEFDQKFKTRTMLYYLTLDEIRHMYTDYTDDKLERLWQEVVNNVFRNSNIRTSTEMKNSEFTKFNNIVSYANSFKQYGRKIIHPVHVSIFNFGRCYLHPGNKRVQYLHYHIHEKIPVIVTDYTKNHVYKGLEKYKFEGKGLYYTFTSESHGDQEKQYKAYKEVNAWVGKIFKDRSFGQIEHLDDGDVRQFEYKNDKVYYNDKLILAKGRTGRWQTYLPMR